MAVPTAPYCETSDVAALLPTLLRGETDFTSGTAPNKATVSSQCTLISNQLEMQFQAAGYYVPFQIITGESWTTAQTNYLKLTTMFGVAAMAGAWILKPAPALDPGRRGGTGNIWQDMFNTELQKIYNPAINKTTLRFRALFYPDTPAEQVLEDPRGPTTDFLEGKYDPYRYLDMHRMADKMWAIQQAMVDLDVNWDYLYNLFDLDKGFGQSVYE